MIPVYKNEIDAGIGDLVKSTASVVFNSKTTLADMIDDTDVVAKAITMNQIDLHYLESILVSMGWNENTDVFTKAEAWRARNTPVDKQFNFMHDESDIIGHITASKVIGIDGKIVSDDTPLDDVPDYFDIVVSSVLYKSWGAESLQERMESIINGIKNGEWFVSMECLFRDFDYAIREKGEKNFKVLSRNEETSFLTKHLRAYGGDGIFDNQEVGRVLKNFVFSGKGLVDNPANPKSHILTNFGVASILNKKEEIQNMSSTNDKVVSAEQYDELKAELAQAKVAAEKAVQKEIEGLKAELVSANETQVSSESNLENVKALSEEKDTKITSLESALADANSKLEEAEKELASMQDEIKKASRVSALVGVGVDTSKAEEIVNKFSKADDTMFAEVIELHRASCEFDKKEDKKDDKKKKEEKKEDAKADENADADALEDAKAEETPTFSSSEDNHDESRKATAAWIGGWLKSSAKE